MDLGTYSGEIFGWKKKPDGKYTKNSYEIIPLL